jgi:serine/threonine-protein kinase RsbW
MTSSEPGSDAIELTFPASSRYVRLSRLAAASLATELDFDVEEVDDLRIAVDEVVTLLVDGEHGGRISIRFVAGDGSLTVEGRCEGALPGAPAVSDLVEAILSATTDHHEIRSTAEERSFSITKTRVDDAGERAAEAWEADGGGSDLG